ncbi:unnamed protein product, partial [Iphiclides podalirius]
MVNGRSCRIESRNPGERHLRNAAIGPRASHLEESLVLTETQFLRAQESSNCEWRGGSGRGSRACISSLTYLRVTRTPPDLTGTATPHQPPGPPQRLLSHRNASHARPPPPPNHHHPHPGAQWLKIRTMRPAAVMNDATRAWPNHSRITRESLANRTLVDSDTALAERPQTNQAAAAFPSKPHG